MFTYIIPRFSLIESVLWSMHLYTQDFLEFGQTVSLKVLLWHWWGVWSIGELLRHLWDRLTDQTTALLLPPGYLPDSFIGKTSTDSCDPLNCMWLYWRGWSHHWLSLKWSFIVWFYNPLIKIPYLYKTYGPCECVGPPLVSRAPLLKLSLGYI